MLCMRPIGLFFLSLLAFGWAEEYQHQTHQNPLDHDRHHDAAAEIDDIVRELGDDSVKAALIDHLAPKYREGVFEGGKKAIDTIRQESPELVGKVIDAAIGLEAKKNDLRKRQSNNSTASSSASSSSSSSFSSSSVVVVSSSSSTSSSSTSRVTTTTSSTTTSTSTSSTKDSIPVVTSTHVKGKTIVYTYTPTKPDVTTIIHLTTKLPDGSTTTHTVYTIFSPKPPTTTPSADPASQGHNKPDLQTGDAARTGGYVGELAALFGVALGVAAMI